MMEVDARLALRIHERQPVAVEVEPVVVGSSARPHLVVLAIEWVGDKRLRPVHVRPVGVPIASVRIQDRLDVEDPLAPVALDFRSGPRHEPVRRQHRRLGG